MSRVLIAIDGSENAMKAVEFAGSQLAVREDAEVMLLHVLPYVPAPFWDDGHIQSEEEKAARSAMIEKWLAHQRRLMEPTFKEAAERLSALGVPAERIATKTISDSTDAAESIVEEARDGGFAVIVLGRCGHGKAHHFPLGSVATKVVGLGEGLNVCVVG